MAAAMRALLEQDGGVARLHPRRVAEEDDPDDRQQDDEDDDDDDDDCGEDDGEDVDATVGDTSSPRGTREGPTGAAAVGHHPSMATGTQQQLKQGGVPVGEQKQESAEER
eukprot:GHVU01073084.1.p3 GENE.GHVU01073084.1~~GHVU01073084.1.p3  ORF type:complete len:110 (-),score=34.86 GHVU01073084.1:515-844(-)